MFKEISGRGEIKAGELDTFKNIAGHGDEWVDVRWLRGRKAMNGKWVGRSTLYPRSKNQGGGLNAV